MRRSTVLALAVLMLAAALALPQAALAKSRKIPTVIRPYWSAILQPHKISGKLIYRPVVVRNGRRHRVDKRMNGTVRLYRMSMTNYRWVGVETSNTVLGKFKFNTQKPGFYLIQYGGVSTRTACRSECYLVGTGPTVTDVTATQVSQDSSGALLVHISATLTGKRGNISASQPGYFEVYTGSSFYPYAYYSPLLGYYGMGGMYMGPYVAPAPGTFRSFSQSLVSWGTYKLGFTVPAAARDTTLAVSVVGGGEYLMSSVATLTIVPSQLPTTP